MRRGEVVGALELALKHHLVLQVSEGVGGGVVEALELALQHHLVLQVREGAGVYI